MVFVCDRFANKILNRIFTSFVHARRYTARCNVVTICQHVCAKNDNVLLFSECAENSDALRSAKNRISAVLLVPRHHWRDDRFYLDEERKI